MGRESEGREGRKGRGGREGKGTNIPHTFKTKVSPLLAQIVISS